VNLPEKLAVDTVGMPARGDADELQLDTMADWPASRAVN
jgi:hypothetical protein